MQVVQLYLQPFWQNLLLKCVLQPEITKKSRKHLILTVQGCLWSSMSSACYDKQHVCTCLQPFFTLDEPIMANNVFLWGYPVWCFRSMGTFSHRVTKFCHKNLRPWAAHREAFVILACTIFIQYSSVTDGQTDVQAMAKTREAFCCCA